MKSLSSAGRGERGASLVEVLVAAVILGFGMLGIAALQSLAMRNSQSSLERSQAVMHGYAILDAMRANSQVAQSNGYNMAKTCEAPATGDLSANDRRRWISSLKSRLGSEACGSIACNAGNCTVTVEWNDSRGTGGIAAQQIAINGRIL